MPTLLLDRDGVINRDSARYIRSPADWQPLPGSLEAIVRAQRAGYRVIVVSNQSGLARGLLGIRDLNAIHRHLQSALAQLGGRIEAFFFCPHAPDENCDCRKPRGGLLRSLGERLSLDLEAVPLIGDRPSDAHAARSVGARAILVRTGFEALSADALKGLEDIEIYDDLATAVDALL